MPGVYADLRGFVLAHRPCTGPRHANAGPPTVGGYRLIVAVGAEPSSIAGSRSTIRTKTC
jgi:hypothetical protein